MASLLENLMNLHWVAGLIEGEGSFGVDEILENYDFYQAKKSHGRN